MGAVRKGIPHLLLLCALALTVPTPVYAVDARVQSAMRQLKMNHFREAAGLYYDLSSVKAGELGTAHLSLGAAFLKNAMLYRELHDLSVAVHLDYLKRISSKGGKERSRMANLYMAESLLAAGEPGAASSYFQAAIADPKVREPVRAIARVGLGMSNFLLGRKGRAEELWSPLTGSQNPEVMSQLASAFARAGKKSANPSEICDRAISIAGRSGKPLPMRVVSNSIGVFAGAGQVEKALRLIRDVDMKAYSNDEDLGRNKTIRFYSPSLLDSLAVLYGKASIRYLRDATGDPKVGRTAQYYLGQAYAHMGRTSESLAAIDSIAGSGGGVPARQMNAALMMRAGNLYAKGSRKEGVELLNKLARQNQSDPFLLAEAVMSCSGLGSGCDEILSSAARLAGRGEGREYSRINFALGKYHLERENLEMAVSYLEAGRDKSNKNRIEYNDPFLLVDLAQAYYRTKKFSEALEIFFGMSGQFPAVRQIQNAMQGVYSMEQKSAGDVKVL